MKKAILINQVTKRETLEAIREPVLEAKNFYEILAGRLRRTRKLHGLSMKQLERLIEGRTNLVWDIETGRLKMSIDVLVKICKIFKVSTDEFIN